jgi:hypothetical protein
MFTYPLTLYLLSPHVRQYPLNPCPGQHEKMCIVHITNIPAPLTINLLYICRNQQRGCSDQETRFQFYNTKIIRRVNNLSLSLRFRGVK